MSGMSRKCLSKPLSTRITVHKTIITFRRSLWGETLDMFVEMVQLCDQAELSNEPDRCRWILDKKGIFTARSLYAVLITQQVLFPFKNLLLEIKTSFKD